MIVVDLSHGARPSGTWHGGRFWEVQPELGFLNSATEIKRIRVWQ